MAAPGQSLLGQLHELAKWVHDTDDSPLAIKLAKKGNRKHCMDMLDGFYEHVLQSFPSPREYPWPVIHEKIKLIEASFDVFALIGSVFCDADNFSTFSRQLFTRLLNICHVLEEWLDVIDVSVEPGDPTPRDLNEKGERACAGLLRSWLGCMKMEKNGLRGWQVAKEMMMECVASCRGVFLAVNSTRHSQSMRRQISYTTTTWKRL